jgi:hypothetical protein
MVNTYNYKDGTSQINKTWSSQDTEFGSIIKCCKDLFDSSQNCKVNHIRRQTNRVAHELAQIARVSASH